MAHGLIRILVSFDDGPALVEETEGALPRGPDDPLEGDGGPEHHGLEGVLALILEAHEYLGLVGARPDVVLEPGEGHGVLSVLKETQHKSWRKKKSLNYTRIISLGENQDV